MAQTSLVDLRTAIITAQQLAKDENGNSLDTWAVPMSRLICALFDLDEPDDLRLMLSTVRGVWTADHALESYRHAGRIPGRPNVPQETSEKENDSE